jgi:hypothetical protein
MQRCNVSIPLASGNPKGNTYCREFLNEKGECPIHGSQIQPPFKEEHGEIPRT